MNTFPARDLRIILLLVLLIVVLLPVTAHSIPNFFGKASPPSLEQRYNQAKFYYNQLETARSISKNRANWLKGADNFRQIYLSQPTSEYAPACLYMLGRLYHSMYERFNKRADLDDSINYYTDVVRLFPRHDLADDAYYAIGLIYLSDLKQPEKASVFFTKVVTEYPNGDIHPITADLLKQLSRDHNIPLPKVMVGSSPLDKLSYVLPVKYWSSDDYTRVVVMASGPVSYKERLLEMNGDKPRRLYIDFSDSYIEPRYREPVPIQDGLLKQIRTGQFSKDTVRVVLDIESIDSYKIYSLPDPFRVVIDVRGGQTGKQPVTVALKERPPQPASSQVEQAKKSSLPEIIILKEQKKYRTGTSTNQVIGTSQRKRVRDVGGAEEIDIADNQKTNVQISLAQQLGLGVKRIVLDPGHGGKDPGAIANGLKEKDIVLRLAKELQPRLAEDLGCEVLLTRDDDVFISLEERTAIANTQSADLFISLHINAHPSPKVRGLETYFLNLSTNAEAMRVAARENATSTHQMSDLQDILSDIMKNSKINESSRLARQVHQSILLGMKNSNGHQRLKNLGVKQAPFYVLIGAQMPAILIEIAFISNSADAKNLKSREFLTDLAAQISLGITSYVNTNTAGVFPQ